MATDTADATDSPLANPLGALKGYFFQNNMNDPRVNSELRNRMAAAMLSQKKGYPKTVGEGLTAIGDALGDRAVLNQLAQADIAKQQQGTSAVPDVVPQQAAPTGVPAASAVLPPSVANANASVPPDEGAPANASTFDPAAARNRITAMLAGGGQQPNPILVGGQDPSQQAAPNTQALLTPTNPPTPTVLSDVSKAPDVPLRPGTQLAQATTPYVMPKPVEPTPPPVPQMTKRMIDAITAAQNYPNNEYVQQRAQAVIAQEKAVIDAQSSRENELFKSRLNNYQTQMAEYQKWLAATDTRALAQQKQPFELNKLAAETQDAMARAAAGKVPTTRDINGTMMQFDPASGKWIPVPMAGVDLSGPPNVKMSEYQGNSVKFANQMYDASHDIDHTTLTNRKDAIASSIPLIHSYAEGQAYKGAQGAAVRWIMGKLRSESGATINPDEFAREYKSFIPVAGDGPEVVAQKAQARATAEQSMAAAAGPGSAHIDYHVAQDTKAQQRMADEMTEMSKKTGKPIVPGKVYINPDEPGKSRIFTNGRWREY